MDLSSTTGIVALAAGAVAGVALVLAVVLAFRIRRLRAAQQLVLGGLGDRDLVAHATDLAQAFADLRAYVEEVALRLDGRLGTAEERLDGAVAYRALLRYDAYNELSGHQSSSIALLDTTRSGVVITSIHHRDNARVYARVVRDGVGDIPLSPEEAETVRMALAGEVQEHLTP